MRVGIIGLQHESNTFLDRPTTWQDFEKGALLAGSAIAREYREAHHEVGGFFAGLEESGIEPAPIFFAWTTPSGVVQTAAMEKLLAALLGELNKAGELDGLLVAPHGAAVCDRWPDMDGHWLGELRSRVGPRMPIIGTLDLHANLSEAMVHATDALIGYRMNPHLDQRQRGVEAARLMARTLRGEARPTQAAAFPPLAINIERQHTPSSPCSECYQALDEMLADERVLSNSLLLGFPYADVREMGTSVIAITNDDPRLAHELASDFAAFLLRRRDDFAGQLIDVDTAVAKAIASPGPVCLLDMGDNVGGGSPGDGTLLLDAILRKHVKKAFVCLADPESVAQAKVAGTAGRVSLRLGGKTDRRHGEPIAAHVTVRSLHDGRFSETEPRHGGRIHYEMGETAVVEMDDGPTVMLTSRRVTPFSLAQLTSSQVEPAKFQVIVAKGVHAPVAAYERVCATLIRVNTPGVTTADCSRLEYHSRRRPLFPFEKT